MNEIRHLLLQKQPDNTIRSGLDTTHYIGNIKPKRAIPVFGETHLALRRLAKDFSASEQLVQSMSNHVTARF